MTLLVGSIFHVTRKIVSEMTYNVSMGTLNPTIPYHTILTKAGLCVMRLVFVLYGQLVIDCQYQYKCLELLVSKMTCYVLSGMLNSSYSCVRLGVFQPSALLGIAEI